MAFTVVDRLFIVIHGPEEPTDEEWLTYLDAVEQQGIERTVQLIITGGGGPVATQRRYLRELMQGRSVPVAIVSSSAAIRGVVMALSWFNRKIRAFQPDELRDALAYLEIPASRLQLIEREVAGLRASLRPRNL